MDLFDRRVNLEIEIDGYIYRYEQTELLKDALEISFNILKSMDNHASSGTISVKGLSREAIASLSTAYNFETGEFKKTYIKLEAGYADSISTIFEGNIIQIDSDLTNPDMRIDARVISGAYNNQVSEEKAISLKDSTIQQIFDEVAKLNEMTTLIDDNLKTKVIPNYSFYGKPFSHVNALQQNFSRMGNIFIDGKTLAFLDKNKGRANSVKTVIDTYSGLVGTPKYSSAGCAIVSLLNNSLQVGGIIELKNTKIPKLNGDYVINTLSHKGSNRGNEFFSEILARRMS